METVLVNTPTKSMCQDSTEIQKISFNENEFTSAKKSSLQSEDKNLNIENDEVPRVGMLFESYQDVCDFYGRYAKKIGFGMLKRRSNTNDEGKKKSFALACCKSGKPTHRAQNNLKKQPSIKTDCMARIRALLTSDDLYILTVVELEHNHKVTPSEAHMYRSNKKIDTPTKRVLDLNERVGIKISKTYSSFAVEAGGFENVCFGEKDCRNYINKQRRLRLGDGDAEALLNYFRRMQKKNLDFFHVMEVDEKNRIRNVFWADARCRAEYESFSDVVTFDTTYLTNKYDMPFAPFVGVNHHGQSILLGCGLLSDETTDTYIWLFKVWLECMSGIAPKAIITDQCQAIQNAVAHVFPKSHYRLCLWHIMKKIPEKLGRYKSYQKIRSILPSIVYDSLKIDEFEKNWKDMIAEHDLEDSQWLKNLYDDRYRWVPVYVKDTFWAGMSSSQRSESMNSFFDEYIHSRTSLKQFVEQYDMAMLKKIKNEKDEDFRSCNTIIPCITNMGIEKQLGVYTNRIFKIFQEEITSLIFCTSVTFIEMNGSIQTFHVTDNSKRFDECGKNKDQVLYEVTLDRHDFDVKCICRLFEFKGILCRHTLSVLMDQKVDSIPEKYILSRWRKDLKRPHTDIKLFYDEFESNEELIRYNKLYSRLIRIARIGAKSEMHFNNAISYLDEFEEKLLSNVETNQHVSGDKCDQLDQAKHLQTSFSGSKIQSPLQVARKGRPRFKRKESTVEKISKATKKKVSQRQRVQKKSQSVMSNRKNQNVVENVANVQHPPPMILTTENILQTNFVENYQPGDLSLQVQDNTNQVEDLGRLSF